MAERLYPILEGRIEVPARRLVELGHLIEAAQWPALMVVLSQYQQEVQRSTLSPTCSDFQHRRNIGVNQVLDELLALEKEVKDTLNNIIDEQD